MASRIGVGIGAGISAAAIVGGVFNMAGRYHDEMATDRQNAVVAQAFLDHMAETDTDITHIVAGVDERITHFSETVGKACMAVIDKTAPKNIEDVLSASECTFNDNEVHQARDLLQKLRDERVVDSFWVEPQDYLDGKTGLQQVSADARMIIEDAAVESPIRDLTDNMGPLPTIDVEVNQGQLVATKATGNKYDVTPALYWTILAVVGAGVVSVSREEFETPEDQASTTIVVS